MRDKMMFESEGHFALMTAVRAIGGVKQQMRVETMLPRERLPAMHAHVGPLTLRIDREMTVTRE